MQPVRCPKSPESSAKRRIYEIRPFSFVIKLGILNSFIVISIRASGANGNAHPFTLQKKELLVLIQDVG